MAVALSSHTALAATERDIAAGLREGIEAPSQWRASRLLRSASLRLVKGGRPEQEALPEILAELQACNRVRSSIGQRIEEAETLAALLGCEARELLAQQIRDRRGLPERPVQASRLEQLKSCMTELMHAYQLALADAVNTQHSDAVEAQIQLCAVRILEWTWREFQLCRLRYQPLAASSWRRINRVYFALLGRATPDTALPASTAPDFLTDANGCITREQVYLGLQSAGLFDACGWPKANQEFISRYCSSVPGAVRLESSSEGGSFRRFVDADHAGPPSQSCCAGAATLLVVDFSALANAIRVDQQAFFRRDPAGMRSPERLLGLPASARRAAIRLLARDIDNGVPCDTPEIPSKDAGTLYLSAGMATIRALLRQVFSRSAHSQPTSSQPPHARRDPVHQPDNLRTNGDLWQLVHQSARLWRIQNPTTQSNTALSVGTLVALGHGSAGLARPRIARVARILHTSKVLQIDLHELAGFAAPISLTPTDSQSIVASSSEPLDKSSVQRQGGAERLTMETADKGAPLRAMLIYDDDFGWGVITPCGQQFREGDPIHIRTRRSSVDTRLRSIRDASEDFLLFQINPHDPHLGVPSYPRAHKARRRALTYRPRPRLIDSHLQTDSQQRAR